MIKNYSQYMTPTNYDLIFKIKDKCNNKNTESIQCQQLIKKYIFETNRSIPQLKDYENIIKDINLVKNQKEKISYGIFNADALHNMIYTLLLLQKYDNLCIPFQYYIEDKYINDKILMLVTDLYKQPDDMIIADLVKTYSFNFYQIAPYLIVWRSPTQYYINKDLKMYITKAINSKNIRFIFLKLTLIISPNTTHAGILIFDKKQNIFERFEPYGVIPYLESDKLDAFLEKKLLKLFDFPIKYLSPKGLFKNVGFQSISNDNKAYVKKLGDPNGYCLGWTYWYLEIRLNNPDIHPKDLINNLIQNIVSEDKNEDAEKLFINHIRKYASGLDKMKNKFLLDSNVDEKDIYNIVLTKKDLEKVMQSLSKVFDKMINNRIQNI